MNEAINKFLEKEKLMYKYLIWVRINDYQTANTYVWANDDYQAKLLAEAQYGQGNVLSYSKVEENND